MSYEQLVNVEFVKAIEKHPCIWDSKSIHHKNKEITRDVWNKLSRQFQEDVESCRERWRNIRNAFLRSMKRDVPEYGSRKPYYLKPHLNFLMPFVRRVSNNNSDMEENMLSKSECGEDDVKPCIENEASDSNVSFQNNEEQSMWSTATSNKPLKRSFTQSQHNQETSNFLKEIDENESVAKKYRKNVELEEDSDLMFFKSLLRDVRKMSDKQNRKFRFKVLQVVQEVFEDQNDTNRFEESPKKVTNFVN